MQQGLPLQRLCAICYNNGVFQFKTRGEYPMNRTGGTEPAIGLRDHAPLLLKTVNKIVNQMKRKCRERPHPGCRENYGAPTVSRSGPEAGSEAGSGAGGRSPEGKRAACCVCGVGRDREAGGPPGSSRSYVPMAACSWLRSSRGVLVARGPVLLAPQRADVHVKRFAYSSITTSCRPWPTPSFRTR